MKPLLTTIAALALLAGAGFGQETLTLENDQVRVTLARDFPLVLRYEHVPSGTVFDGAEPDARWSIDMISPDRQVVHVGPADIRCGQGSPSVAEGEQLVDYLIAPLVDGQDVAGIYWQILLDGPQVVQRVKVIAHGEGYTLGTIDFGQSIRVALPAEAAQPMAGGGSLGRHESTYFWHDPTEHDARGGDAIDMVFLADGDRAIAAGYNDLLYQPWRYRSRGDDTPAEFWCAPFVHHVPAGAGEHYNNVGVHDEQFAVRIGLLDDYSGDGEVDWCDAAAFIRDMLAEHRPSVPLFQDWLRYEAGTDFYEFIDVMRRMGNEIDHRRQLCLHAGWQYWGWDSEYPAYMEPADELGGRAGLYALMRAAPEHRGIVSLIHNFDDAYLHSPAWDESLIMRREDQSLFDATAWAGGRSYIMGPYKMVELGWAERVIDGLVAQGARLRLFSDVLSAVPWRVDADRNMPAGGWANLAAKLQIVRLMQDRGLTLGSETVTWPFVGYLCTAHSMPLGISGRDDDIPLGPFVLHSKMAYQSWSRGPTTLLAGTDNNTGWDLDAIYTWHYVLAAYADKQMTDFTRDGSALRTDFGPGTHVLWDRPNDVLDVVVDDRLIYNGQAVMVPKETPNVYLAYVHSRAERDEHRFALPPGWADPDELVMHRLTAEGEEPVDAANFVAFDGGEIVIRISKGTPFRICYGRDAYEADREIRQTPLSPPTITWPEDELLEASDPGGRPEWVRIATRTHPEGATLYVGAGAKMDTLEASRAHAASIIASKIQWVVRQGWVETSRAYERELGLDAGAMGYDNWNLGRDAALEIFTLGTIGDLDGVRWYWEHVLDRNPQLPEPREAYKAFVAVPLTGEQLHAVYLRAIELNLQRARAAVAAGEGDRRQLDNRVRIWEHMLQDQRENPTIPTEFMIR